ncbi:hypothetical protein M0802_000097 [Mischocyttarus mexicanus]|nr:hypothetical protein M0802_000097 [Mischocyttarus mexicanus]
MIVVVVVMVAVVAAVSSCELLAGGCELTEQTFQQFLLLEAPSAKPRRKRRTRRKRKKRWSGRKQWAPANASSLKLCPSSSTFRWLNMCIVTRQLTLHDNYDDDEEEDDDDYDYEEEEEHDDEDNEECSESS